MDKVSGSHHDVNLTARDSGCQALDRRVRHLSGTYAALGSGMIGRAQHQ